MADHPKARTGAYMVRCNECKAYGVATHKSVCICRVDIGGTINANCANCCIDDDTLLWKNTTWGVIEEFGTEEECDQACESRNVARMIKSAGKRN